MYFDAAACMKQYREQGEEAALINIIDAFNPIISKYSKKFPRDQQEDVQQELIIALIISVRTMKRYENSGECINYWESSIKNSYYKLLRKEIEKNTMECAAENMTAYMEAAYSDELEIDELKQFIQKNSKSEKKAAIWTGIFINGYSGGQIAEYYGVTRQYIHKIKKEFINLYRKEHDI